MADQREFQITFTVPPGNSEFVIPWDSTRGPFNSTRDPPTTPASIAAGSPLLAPGRHRGRYRGWVLLYTIKTTTQNVTVDEQIKTGAAGTSADWETQGATGTFVVTAGTTAPRKFTPYSPDHRILVTAGATGPATLVFNGTAYYQGEG